MKILFFLCIFSTSAYPLSYTSFTHSFMESLHWYSGEIHLIPEPIENESEGLKVTFEDLSPLLNIINATPYSTLVTKAMKILGIETAEELTDLIYVCKFKNEKISGRFEARQGSTINFVESKEGQDPADIIKNYFGHTTIPAIYTLKETQTEIPFTLFSYLQPEIRICIIPELSVTEASKTLVHELVHFVNKKLVVGTPVSKMTENQFLKFILESPGGEKSAYYTEIQFSLTLAQSFNERNKVLQEWGKSVNLRGEIIDHNMFDRIILEEKNYKDPFLKQRAYYQLNEKSNYNFMVKMIKSWINQIEKIQQFIMETKATIINFQQIIDNNKRISKINQLNLELTENNLKLNLSDQQKAEQIDIKMKILSSIEKGEKIQNDNLKNLEKAGQILQDSEVRLANTIELYGSKEKLTNFHNSLLSTLNSL